MKHPNCASLKQPSLATLTSTRARQRTPCSESTPSGVEEPASTHCKWDARKAGAGTRAKAKLYEHGHSGGIEYETDTAV